jgi:hypothetical protein
MNRVLQVFRKWRDADSNRGHYDFQLSLDPLTTVYDSTESVIGMRMYVAAAHHRSPLSSSSCRLTVVTWFGNSLQTKLVLLVGRLRLSS